MTFAQTVVSFLKCVYSTETQQHWIMLLNKGMTQAFRNLLGFIIDKKENNSIWRPHVIKKQINQRGKSPLSHTFPSAHVWPPVAPVFV